VSAAGVIVAFAAIALVRETPLAPPDEAFPSAVPALASLPRPVVFQVPALTAATFVSPSEHELSALLREGRFDALLRHGVALADAGARERWLGACARLAPPPVLAAHAIRLSPGPERERLLAAAVDRWTLDDPAAVGEWAARHLATVPELDLALTRIVESTDILHRPTATALAWADELSDPRLRLRALRQVVREWAAQDAAAALRFAESTDAVDAGGRRELLAALRVPVAET
jgi:hypothetical protein